MKLFWIKHRDIIPTAITAILSLTLVFVLLYLK